MGQTLRDFSRAVRRPIFGDIFPQIVNEFEDGDRLFASPVDRYFKVDSSDVRRFHGLVPAWEATFLTRHSLKAI